MHTIQQELETMLRDAARRCRDAGLPAELPAELETLAGQVNKPCVVAVVGRVKAGKSTFVNALLGADLAKVGTTETTATINYFSYGEPQDPARPVRCHWRGGGYEDQDRAFLDSLQGNDEATLRRAEGISHLEYFVPAPLLQQVTLVDTPGTGAVVDEHQQRTAEYLRLESQLRDRHDQETQQHAARADAVIYLIGEVARTDDRSLIEAFGQQTSGQSRALNAVGVLAKIDKHPAILERRQALAEKIAAQLTESLNTVVPVSAGIERALADLTANDQARLRRWIELLRKVPPEKLDKLLADEGMFWDVVCPLSDAERQELYDGVIPWAVFTAIARIAADPQAGAPAVARELSEIAGFARLREVLDRHFFRRSRFLVCHRILSDARRLLDDIRYIHEPATRRQNREDRARFERFIALARRSPGDSVARELETYAAAQLARRPGDFTSLINSLDRHFSRLYHQLDEHNADFAALEVLEKHRELFNSDELEELRPLLGLYGLEHEQRVASERLNEDAIAERQMIWRQRAWSAPHPARREVAERAETRYGLILSELMGSA